MAFNVSRFQLELALERGDELRHGKHSLQALRVCFYGFVGFEKIDDPSRLSQLKLIAEDMLGHIWNERVNWLAIEIGLGLE